MTDTQVIKKYGISDEDLLQIRAMWNGTSMVCDSKHIERMPAAERGPVSHVESFSERDRAMTLFMMLSSEELAVLVN